MPSIEHWFPPWRFCFTLSRKPCNSPCFRSFSRFFFCSFPPPLPQDSVMSPSLSSPSQRYWWNMHIIVPLLPHSLQFGSLIRHHGCKFIGDGSVPYTGLSRNEILNWSFLHMNHSYNLLIYVLVSVDVLDILFPKTSVLPKVWSIYKIREYKEMKNFITPTQGDIMLR